MPRMLSHQTFSATRTPKGSWVQVPVIGFFENPVIQVSLIGGVIGLLKKYAEVKLLHDLFPFIPTVWTGVISDLLLMIGVPTLVVILELRRRSLTSLKG